MDKYFETLKLADKSHIKVSISYSIGGMNPFTSAEEKRGVYVSFTPVKRIQKDGYTLEEYDAYSGVKFCFLELRRNSKKSLEKAASMIQPGLRALVEMFESGDIEGIAEMLEEIKNESERQSYYVICYDTVWHDHMVCICKDIEEAEMVEERWKSHPEKSRVRIAKNEPAYPAVVWYRVSDEGTVVRAR